MEEFLSYTIFKSVSPEFPLLMFIFVWLQVIEPCPGTKCELNSAELQTMGQRSSKQDS